MPSTIKKPSRLGKGSSTLPPSLAPVANRQRGKHSQVQGWLLLSALALVACLLLGVYAQQTLVSELCKALAIVVILNVFRVTANNTSIHK